MLISSLPQIDEIFAALEEAHRRVVGVRRFRNMRKARVLKIKRKGKGSMVHRARKLHKAINKGPMYNRHRRG